MVIIEVGPKAYVSKLSLEELHAHVKPLLLRPPHTVTSLIKGIVEVMITSTCEVGTMNRHGMYPPANTIALA